MPKSNIDFSKCVIYKIYCTDDNIKECYVGMTTDITRRIYYHKQHSKCEKNKNLYLYSFINNHGGWGNWTIEKIEDYPCNNSMEAHDRETHWINSLEAELNSVVPFNRSQWKKEWYFKHQERIRLHQKEYREKNKQIKDKQKQEYLQHLENYKIDYDNLDNNPEWFKNNVKRHQALLI